MAKEKQENNHLTGLITFAVVLFFISYMIVFFVGRNNSLKNKPKYETVELHEYDVDIKKVDIKEESVQTAIKNYESFMFDEEVYHLDSLELEELSTYYFIVGALNNIDKERIAYCISDNSGLKEPINLDMLNEAVHKLGDINISMDDLVNYARETSNTVGTYGYGVYSLLIDGGNIYVIGACDAMGNQEHPYASKIEQAEEFGDYIHIYQRVAFGVRKGDRIAYYDNYQRDGSPKETIDASATPNYNKKTYALYKITFLKVGDNYYFQSMESR